MQTPSEAPKNLMDHPVFIDPRKSLSARVFDVDKELIQFQALIEVSRHVTTTLDRVEEFVKELERQRGMPSGVPYMRIHDAILVDGPRGSGKSSFLLSVIDFMCGDASRHSRFCERPQKRLCSLGIIDPTMITSKENIFILIISKISELVKRKFEDNLAYRRDPVDFNAWNVSLNDLSRGLCMLDGVGKEPLKQVEWEDPQYVVKEGLANAAGGVRLERNFHRFVLESLKLLEKDAFLVGIDDIDTDFNAGWPVLEILRKYLTTPQLIIMISGDYSLYSKLVRRQQWEYFQGRKEYVDHLSIDSVRDVIQRLESQYLTKILRPELRVTLKGVWELDKNIYIVPPQYRALGCDECKTVKIIFLLQAFIELWYIYPHQLCGRIAEHLTHLSLRNLMNLLLVIDGDGRLNANLSDDVNQKESSGVVHINRSYRLACKIRDIYEADKVRGVSGRNKIKDDLLNVEAVEVRLVHSEIMRVMYSRLVDMGFTQDELQTVQWTGQLNKIAQILSHQSLLKHGASLLPSNVMLQDGLGVLALSGICMSAMTGDIKHAFHYYVRVLMVRDCVVHLESNVPGLRVDDRRFVKTMMSPSSSLQDVAVDVVRAYYEQLDGGDFKKIVSLAGLVKVKKFSSGLGDDAWLEYLYNAIVVQVFAADGGEPQYYFSPLNMMAVLGMCAGTTGDLDLELRRMRAPRIINPGLDYVVKRRGHLPPVITDAADKKMKDFSSEMHVWAKGYYNKYKGQILLPPYMHAEVWADFTSSLSAVKSMNEVCSRFLLVVKKNESIFMDDKKKKNIFHEFVKGCPLWGVMEKLNAHIIMKQSSSKKSKDVSSK